MRAACHVSSQYFSNTALPQKQRCPVGGPHYSTSCSFLFKSPNYSSSSSSSLCNCESPFHSSLQSFNPMLPALTLPSQSSFASKLHPSRAKITTCAANKSLYQVLRVERNASQTEIKTAYRTLAKLYHPDATLRFIESSTDGQDFVRIHNAYATLSDPDARAVYDFNLNGGARCRWNNACPSGLRRRFYPTRRWESDQCW